MHTTNDILNEDYLVQPNELRNALTAALLSAAREERDIDEAQLHAALRSYVKELKEAQLPPERVLIVIKDMTNASGVSNSSAEHGVRQRREVLMETIVKWSIAEYYRAD